MTARPLHSRLFWLMLGVVALITQPAQAQNGATSLDEAVRSGLVTVEAHGSDDQFGQLSLTLSPTGSPLPIVIAPGDRFIPGDPALAEVASTQRYELLLQEPETIDPFLVVSLTVDRAQPSPMSTVPYSTGEPAGAPIIALLESTDPVAAGYALQLAVWAISEGRDVDEIAAGLSVPPVPEDLAEARRLVGNVALPEPAASTAPAITPSEPGESATSPATGEDGQNDDSGVSVGVILAVIGLLVIIAAAASVLASRKQRGVAPERSRGVSPGPDRPVAEQEKTPLHAGAVRPITERGSTFSGSALRLVGRAGPHAGIQLLIKGDTILARDPIEIITLPGLAVPHVYLYWTDQGVEVKDLGSEPGTRLGDDLLSGKGPATARFGQMLRLGNIQLQLTVDGFRVHDKIHKAAANKHCVLSGRQVQVAVLGQGDTRVSNPHCLISHDGQGFAVRDLRSSNGVTVDGVRLNVLPVPIGPDSVISLGQSSFGLPKGELNDHAL